MDSWRVAVLGDGGVGKTALAVQFTLNCFVGESRHQHLRQSPAYRAPFSVSRGKPPPPPNQHLQLISLKTYDPTIEDAYRKQLVVDNKMCFVEVIDTAGQEEYATLRDQWVREGQGFILVYSIASRSTFDRLEIFRQSMRKVKRGDPIFMLVGNKCDKAYEREVSREEGAALARQFGCEFIETSAKTALNVERLFMNLVRALRNTRSIEPGTPVHQEPTKKAPKKSRCIIL